MKRSFFQYVSLNVLGALGLSGYILADTLFVAHGLGTDGLAALNLAISVFGLINGLGLMLGIGVDPQKRSDYVRALQEKGVLVLTAGEDTISLLPPLVITKEDIDQALACMKEVLK